MALTDESGMGTTMLVQPSGISNNSGFGGLGGDGWWIILLFILLANGGWGMGGYGMDGGLYPWMNNSQNINNGFRDQMINGTINGIQQSVNSGFSDVQMALCNGFASIENGANNRQMANMQTMFGLQSQLANCCCENRLASANLQSVIQTENCADRQVVSDGIRDILVANNANTQRILDQMCNDKIDAKNDTINQLRAELLYARGQASQDVQTAQIMADNARQTTALEQYLNPTPIPAYVVANPNCCQQTYCGCAA